MKNFTRISIIAILVILVLIGLDGIYIVDETEQVVITQFGAPVGDIKTEPGMKMKIPFVQDANYFEKRYLEWDGDRNQVPTKDKKFIFVDTYARWQITDPLQFFKRLRDERGAQSRLDDILDGETRNAIASHDFVEIVRSTNREPIQEGIISEVVEDSLADISVGRDSIQTMIQQLANKRTSDLGIAVLDFRFKRINYVEEVRQTVYERMVSERRRIAEKFRSEGQGEASRINGEKERELKQIQSEAFRTAEEIRGRADAEAAAVYAEAYNKTPQARELYSFVRSMEAYRNTFDDKTSIFISTESDFYQFLQHMNN